MSTCLLIIDPQQDFCSPSGSLFVTGADKDMARLSSMIKKHGGAIDEINLTMDSHYLMSISHPNFWRDPTGNIPKPFTLISVEDVEKGKWRPYSSEWEKRALQYVKTLQENNRYVLCIWPPHCIIGGVGQTLVPCLFEAVSEWETKYFAVVPRITKGSNPFTEHYSCVKADVPDPKDPGTRLNGRFIDTLKQYDDILISGEALSHCVNFSITDVAEEFSIDQVKKFILLEDTSSSVTGFEKQGQDFVNKMLNKGMRVARTDTYFK